MDKTLAWLWLADAVGSACQNARDLLALYPTPRPCMTPCTPGAKPRPTF